jgi:hypothetical protein
MSKMTFWHIQMHPDDPSLKPEKISDILVKTSLIGLNFDKDTPVYNHFRNTMKPGDIVLVRQGHTPVALVEVTGEWQFLPWSKCNEDLDWFRMRRKVRVLEYASPSRLNDKFPKVMGTLERLVGNTASRRYVESWYHSLKGDHMHENEIELLKANLQIILTGAPGTGKTYKARQMAAQLIGCKPEAVDGHEHYRFVQFHSSYDYGDFVEGLKPVLVDKQVHLLPTDGAFKEFCLKARHKPKETFVFVIDEINRADLSRVFGELFFAIEADYRGKLIDTQYTYMTGNQFAVPENVLMIGTMNDIDRSVESIDFALRRRFAWVEVVADGALFDQIAKPKLGSLFDEAKKRYLALNEAIDLIPNLGDSYRIGPAYFLKLTSYNDDPFESLWNYHLRVLIREYVRGYPDAAAIENQLRDAYGA